MPALTSANELPSGTVSVPYFLGASLEAQLSPEVLGQKPDTGPPATGEPN